MPHEHPTAIGHGAAPDPYVARMQRLRAERKAWTHEDPPVGLFLAVGLGAVLTVSIVAYTSYDPRSPVASVVVTGGMAAFIFVLTVMAVVMPRAMAASTCIGPLYEVARQWGGRVDPKLSARVAWLDRHWLGQLSLDDVRRAEMGGCVALDVRGYPALIVVDPLGSSNKRGSRLDVYLAGAALAAQAGGVAPPVAELQLWLAHWGFSLAWSAAGLRAIASPSAAADLTDPWLTAHAGAWASDGGGDANTNKQLEQASAAFAAAMAEILHALATTAERLGAAPVTTF